MYVCTKIQIRLPTHFDHDLLIDILVKMIQSRNIKLSFISRGVNSFLKLGGGGQLPTLPPFNDAPVILN